eukprot:TRINITY_DN6201_c0_g1_i1.p1 TRINITY_DN6201_c0_g1~~TRINITY_DN6201_c0_g1_i1.p1  ORF type:complete len:2086 (+),score=809.59 TRINITY_DN6201_c0_g1_i1:159-6416(+)
MSKPSQSLIDLHLDSLWKDNIASKRRKHGEKFSSEEKLPSKDEFLNRCKEMNYKNRIAYAVELGLKYKNDPKLKTLMEDLNKMPEMATISADMSDEFTEILPNAEKDTEKAFTQHQLAFFLSCASENNEELMKELESSRSLLSKKAANEFVRQEKSDEKVFDFVLKTVPKTRKGIISECISKRRVGVLDKLFEHYFTSDPNYATSFLHGCSDKVIQKFLESKENRDISTIRWKNIQNRQTDSVFSALESELSSLSPLDRKNTWEKWGTRLNSKCWISFPKKLEAFCKLMVKYPIITWDGVGQYSPSLPFDPSTMTRTLPSIYQTNKVFFLTHAPEHIIQFLEENTVKPDGVVSINSFVSNSWELRSIPIDIKHLLKITKKVLEHPKVTLSNYYSTSSKMFYNLTFDSDKVVKSDDASLSKLFEVIRKYFADPKNRDDFDAWDKSFFELFSVDYSTVKKRRMLYGLCPIYKDRMERPLYRAGTCNIESPSKFVALYNEETEYGGKDCVEEYCTGVLWAKMLNEMTEEVYLKKGNSYDPSSETWANNLMGAAMRILKSKEPLLESYKKEEAKRVCIEVFERIEKIFEKNSQSSFELRLEYFPSLAFPSQHFRVFKLFNKQNIEGSEKVFDAFIRLLSRFYGPLQLLVQKSKDAMDIDEKFDAKSASDEVQKLIESLVSAKKLNAKQLDRLKSFRDSSSENVWKDLVKDCASSNRDERKEGMIRIIRASFYPRSSSKYAEMLQLVRDRTKNEIEGVRETIIQNLTAKPSWKEKGEDLSYDFQFNTPEARKAWMDILQNALSSIELEDNEGEELLQPGEKIDITSKLVENEMLNSFRKLSKRAIANGLSKGNEEIFEFGVGIQWELAQFVLGPSKALVHFKVDFPSNFYGQFKQAYFKRKNRKYTYNNRIIQGDHAEHFIKLFSSTLRKLLGEAFEDVRESYLHWGEMIRLVGSKWKNCPDIVNYIEKLIKVSKEKLTKEEKGGFLVIEEDPLLKIYQSLGCHRPFAIPTVTNIARFIAESRSCNVSIIPFFSYISNHSEADEAEITKDQLFINGKKFLLNNSLDRMRAKDRAVQWLLSVSSSAIHFRPVWNHLVSVRQEKLNPFLNARTGFPGIYKTLPPKKRVVVRKRGVKPKNLTEIVRDEKEAEEKLQVSLKEATNEIEKKSNEGVFILPAIFGTRRLNQDQSRSLGEDLKNASLNTSIPISKRTSNTRRWTILPSTSFAEIVQFIQENEEKDKKQIPLNIVKAAYIGLLYGDDKLMPLHFLLSEKVLKNADFTAVAIYSLSKAVGYLHTEEFVKIVSGLLNEERRKEMKITIHKQILRLLALKPSLKSLELIVRELENSSIHRDVRIAGNSVLTKFLFLHDLSASAWKTLVQAGKRRKIDELIVLLSTVPQNFESKFQLKEQTLINLEDQYSELLATVHIPTAFAEKYARELIYYISKEVSSDSLQPKDKGEDLILLAKFSLLNWVNHFDHNAIAREMLEIATREKTSSPSNYLEGSNRTFYFNQFDFAMNSLFDLCSLNECAKIEGKADRKLVNEAVVKMIDLFEKSENSMMKAYYLRNLEWVLENLPSFSSEVTQTLNLTEEELNSFYEPFKRLKIFQFRLMEKEIDVKLSNSTDPLPLLPAVYKEIFDATGLRFHDGTTQRDAHAVLIEKVLTALNLEFRREGMSLLLSEVKKRKGAALSVLKALKSFPFATEDNFENVLELLNIVKNEGKMPDLVVAEISAFVTVWLARESPGSNAKSTNEWDAQASGGWGEDEPAEVKPKEPEVVVKNVKIERLVSLIISWYTEDPLGMFAKSVLETIITANADQLFKYTTDDQLYQLAQTMFKSTANQPNAHSYTYNESVFSQVGKRPSLASKILFQIMDGEFMKGVKQTPLSLRAILEVSSLWFMHTPDQYNHPTKMADYTFEYLIYSVWEGNHPNSLIENMPALLQKIFTSGDSWSSSGNPNDSAEYALHLLEGKPSDEMKVIPRELISDEERERIQSDPVFTTLAENIALSFLFTLGVERSDDLNHPTTVLDSFSEVWNLLAKSQDPVVRERITKLFFVETSETKGTFQTEPKRGKPNMRVRGARGGRGGRGARR